MPDISTLTLSGRTYTIKDSVARSITAGAIKVRGTTATPITDESKVNPITIAGNSYIAIVNDAVFYGKKEFVFDGLRWHEFGDMTGLGDLAKKSSANGTYTPEGTVSQPTFTGNELTSTGKFTPSGSVTVVEDATGNYQPEGSVSAPVISISAPGSTKVVNFITDVGTLPSLNVVYDEDTENLTIGLNSGTLPTKGEDVTVKTGEASYTASQPTFTGTKVQLGFSGSQGNVNVSGTPAGSVSAPTFSGTEATITVS